MRIKTQGNFISIQIPENEGQPDVIQLPDGYSFEKIHIAALTNMRYLIPTMQISLNESYTFPPVNSNLHAICNLISLILANQVRLSFTLKNLDKYQIDTILIPHLLQF